jgi:phage terminase large subunit GpA-like protein
MLVIGTQDVQRQPPRVEIMWVGYGAEQEMWLLDWEMVPGDLDLPNMQKILGAHVFGKKFKHPYLGEIKPYCYGMDYGYQTKVKAVHKFCSAHRFQKMYAVKGFAHESLSALAKYEYDRRERCRKWHFNVDNLKSDVFDQLRVPEAGPRCIHIPKAVVTLVGEDGAKRTIKTKFDDRFYQELCSERRMTKRNPDGTMTYRWVKISESARNEPLDLLVYNVGLYGAHNLDAEIGQEWKKVQAMMREKEELERKAAKSGGSGVPPPAKGGPATPTAPEKELTEEEMKPREIKVPEAPRNPGGAPPRHFRRPMMQRPQQKRPPWQRGVWNPLNI